MTKRPPSSGCYAAHCQGWFPQPPSREGWPRVSRVSQLLIAVIALVVAVIALLFYFVVGRAPDEHPNFGGFVILTVICVGLTVALFLAVLPAAEHASQPSKRLSQAGITSSLLALVAMVVYWTALPFVLGAGGVVLGRLGEARAARELERSGGAGREDEAQAEQDDDTDPAPGQRASQGWVAAVLGGLVFLACVIVTIVSQFIP